MLNNEALERKKLIKIFWQNFSDSGVSEIFSKISLFLVGGLGVIIFISFFLFYHLEYSGYCLYLYWYIQNVSTDASFSRLLVFHVKLRSLQGTSNQPFI